VITGALNELAARGIVLADDRWVRYAVERRRHRLRPPRRATAARVNPQVVRARLERHATGTEQLPVDLLLDAPPPPATPLAGDVLGAAGLPRTLLVGDETLARLLRAHDLHLETGAAVLAQPAAELPAWLLDGIERAGEGARVLVLHDASVASLCALDGLAVRLGLPAPARLVAVGVRPAHVTRLRLAAERHRPPAAEDVRRATKAGRLRAAEARWLARGYSAEVAAVAPDRLLRALRRLLLGHPLPARARVVPAREAGFV
jgi:hypothetical protein